MAVSILARKRDLAYFVYFVIHLPVLFIVDLQALYPPSLVPAFMNGIRTWYIATYKDLFFTAPTAFFKLFMWLEAVYHVPVTLWALGGLWRNSPKIPLVLLLYAAETFLTTLTCIVEYLAWDVPFAQKVDLTTLYGPYLALSVFMLVDMYVRLNASIDKASGATSTKVGKKKKEL